MAYARMAIFLLARSFPLSSQIGYPPECKSIYFSFLHGPLNQMIFFLNNIVTKISEDSDDKHERQYKLWLVGRRFCSAICIGSPPFNGERTRNILIRCISYNIYQHFGRMQAQAIPMQDCEKALV